MRDEYKRLGTVSLQAGLDLHRCRVTAIVSDRHASVDFIAYCENWMPGIRRKPGFACCLITTRRTFQKRRKRTLVFTRNVSRSSSRRSTAQWLNIVKTMFSKMAQTIPRGIRVACKQELIDRIHLYFEKDNADPEILSVEV